MLRNSFKLVCQVEIFQYRVIGYGKYSAHFIMQQKVI